MTTEIFDQAPAIDPAVRVPRRPRLPRLPRLPNALLLAVSILGFALVPLFARPLMESGMSPESVALIRFLPGLALAIPVLPSLIGASAKRWPALAFFATGAAMGGSWALYLDALRTVPVAIAGTVYMSYPLFVMLFVWIFYRQPPVARAMLAGGLVVLGAALLIGASGTMGDIGTALDPLLLLCLPAPIAFAAIVVLLVRDPGGLTVLEKFGCSMGGTVLALLALAAAGTPAADLAAIGAAFSLDTLFLILGLALATATLPQMLYTVVAPRMPDAQVATIGALELPFMVGLAWLAFGESLGLWEAAAIAIIFAAIALVPSKPA